MQFTSANITLDGAFKFTATSKGHLYPQLLNLYVDWSKTYVWDPNSMVNTIFLHTVFKIWKHLVMAAVN
jgi:hypothetical protein